MADDIQQVNQPEDKRLMPVLHGDQYNPANVPTALTADEKMQFLHNYYKTGNLTKAARMVGRDRMAFMQHIEKDKAFAMDFYNVKVAIKEDLEEVMTMNGLKEKGYMDRITWLRKNFPQEYNPNADRGGDNHAQDAIKQLSEKLKDYDLVPKSKIVETENDNAL